MSALDSGMKACSTCDLISETELQILRMRVIALRWAFESP